MGDKVEKHKLSKDQITFARDFKQIQKIQQGLMVDLEMKLSDADMVRNQLGELEEIMGKMAQQAPPPFLKELQGQEEAREEGVR